MSIETVLRRRGKRHEYGHLRPDGKRFSNRIIRNWEPRLIAEFDGVPTDDAPWCECCERKNCQAECCVATVHP